MIGNVYEVVKKLKKETNDLKDIIYRKKKMGGKDVYIIYNEPLTSSDKISDFVIIYAVESDITLVFDGLYSLT